MGGLNTGFEKVCDAIEDQHLTASWSWDQSRLMVHCPGPLHSRGDSRPSLSVAEGDEGRALLYCHVGCDTQDIVAALGLEMSDLFTEGGERYVVDQYIYTDAEGNPIIRVSRTEPKGFFQEHLEDGTWKIGVGDAERHVYRLPLVRRAIENGTTVYLVEGEKDVHTLEQYGLVGTTFIGGANKWRDEYAEELKGAKVVIIADRDDAGRKAADNYAAILKADIRYPASGKDVTDHLNAGLSIEELLSEEPVDLDIFSPLDWGNYEVEQTEWLFEPYIPRQGRVLAFGAAGSLKSLWATWLAARLSNEGHRVAYFSLEMRPSEMAKRLRQAKPNPDNFLLFTKLSMGSVEHLRLACKALRGVELIVIDSWTAARPSRDSAESIAELDNDFFQPLMDETGASLLILDNVGHPAFTDAGKMKPDWARGSSAKGDKMELSILFDRPYENNNYRTTLTVKKMRLDAEIPPPVTVETPRDRIEFYMVEEGFMTTEPMWQSDRLVLHHQNPEEEQQADVTKMTAEEQLRLARLKDRLKAVEVDAGLSDTEEPIEASA